MADKIRWGILGCGRIARTFAESLQHVPDAKLAAVASKNTGRAAEFAKFLMPSVIMRTIRNL